MLASGTTGNQGMLSTLIRTQTNIRNIGERFFRAFGIHCATHQIRVILISCVVITSLFYPALALYSSSSLQYLSHLRIITSFTPAPSGSDYVPQDLADLWTSHPSFTVDTTASRLLCGIERTLRVERLLIQSPLAEDNEVLDYQVLLSTLALEDRIQHEIKARGIPCLPRRDGRRCLSLSPLAFWNHDRQKLLSDLNIVETINAQNNISFEGIIVSPPMVVAGRGLNEHPEVRFDHATFLALTYFVTESDCTGNAGHNTWMEALHSATSQTAFSFHPSQSLSEPKLISLQFEDSPAKPKELKLISILTYSVYAVGLAYYTWAIRCMESKMHSCIGLSFTGLVEIAASTITSLSVCALVGFKVTLVPWELLPMILFFVGAENMMNLTEAVAKTSVTLPVKQRIGEGLSRAGTSNTLKLISYNTVLGVIAGFSTGAIQQFCAFAIVVLVAHWFLAHVFYVTVLSIDLQRLELDDLIRQDPSSVPTVAPPKPRGTPATVSRWRQFFSGLLRGRASKNLNLVLLLGVTALLYYTTYSPVITDLDSRNIATPAPRTQPNYTHIDHLLPSQQTWNVLNPKRDPRLHLRIEPPTMLNFRQDADETFERKHYPGRWLTSRSFRAACWLFEIVVLPITVTSGLLYMLLLYLLKNAELLEAQRNRQEPNSPMEEEHSIDSNITFSTLPRVFSTDVDIIASSHDGRVTASVSVHREISIWRKDLGSHISLDTANLLSSIASTSQTAPAITSIALDGDGKFIAIGTDSGVFAVWSMCEEGIQPVSIPSPPSHSSAKVTKLQFIGPIASRRYLLVVFSDGMVLKCHLQGKVGPTTISPAERGMVIRATILHLQSGNGLPLIAFVMDDGTFQLVDIDVSDSTLLFGRGFPAGSLSDTVSQLHAAWIKLAGGDRLVIGAATESGAVSLWDGQSGECIYIMEERYGKITQLRISPISSESCIYCSELPLESFSVAFSANYVILCFKAYLNSQTRHCACQHNQPRSLPPWDSAGRRSRASSISSANGSASISQFRSTHRLSVSSAAGDGIAEFPVSGHGVHSRRVSEKDSSSRISPGALSLPVPTAEFLEGPFSPVELGSPSGSSFWRSLFVRRQADTTCERGGWGVIADNKLLGIRRRMRTTTTTNGAACLSSLKRSSSQHQLSHGLSSATLERWEVWIYDPSTANILSSPLASLTEDQSSTMVSSRTVSPAHSRPSSPAFSKSQRNNINVPSRLPFTRVSPFIVDSSSRIFAGFGNTIGILQNVL